MLESQIDQHERRRVMLNDQRVKEQQQLGTTMRQFAQADADIPGRFAAVANATVICSNADVAGAYPAASAAHQIQLPDEMPTGYRVNDLEPSGGPVEAPTTDPSPGPLSVEHAAGPSRLYRRY